MKQFTVNMAKQSFEMTEALKTLRTNIDFCGSDIKVITVTSCIPNEGKSTICWKLANSMAEAGKKVLFIDADLRRSVLLGTLKIKQKTVGLSHYLSGQSKLEDTLMQSSVPGLYAIFAGSFPPNPSELLGSARFQELLDWARNEFDMVLVDTPPLGAVIDSAIVANVSDGIIWVVAAEKIKRKLALSVKAQMDRTKCPILGVVLNQMYVSEKSIRIYDYYTYKRNYKNYYTRKKEPEAGKTSASAAGSSANP